MRSTRAAILVLALSPLPLADAAAIPIAPEADPAASLSAREPVREIRLDNGLRVFVLERHASPTFAAIYRFEVGGAVDPRGRSGIAHLLEHMMFKGTRRIGTLDHEKEAKLMRRLSELWGRLQVELDLKDDPFGKADPETIRELERQIEDVSAEQKKLIVKNEYDELMTRAGAVGLNASTNHDSTRYYVELPSNRLEFWFRAESERLLDPVFREFYSERDVVREERRLRYENSPGGKMYEAFGSLLFAAHPYGTPVIGWPRDLERLVREDAEAYLRTYYSPSNCTMAIVGDVKATDVERLAKKYFGKWERQRIPPRTVTVEPEQEGERRRVVEFDAEPQLRMGWATVAEGHADQYALDVLATILGGLSSSRLDKTAVLGERIAASVGAGHSTLRHGGYLAVWGTLRGGHVPEDLEAVVDREIARIRDEGVTDAELERAKIRTEVSRVASLKSNMGQAYRIASAVAVSGGVEYLDQYERRLAAVTAEQVREVVRRYLAPARKCVVTLKKTESAGGAPSAGGSGVAHGHGGSSGERGTNHSAGFEEAMKLVRESAPIRLTVPEIGKDVERVVLEGGTTVFIKEDRSAPSVEMSFVWLGGSNAVPLDELAAYELAGDLLDEGGTESLDPVALEERKEGLGLRFNVWIGDTSSGARFWSLKRNFDESFALALEVLKRPRFDAGRLGVLVGQYVESMKRRADSPGPGGYWLLRHVIDGEHPRLGYVPPRAAIEAITPDSIREIWKRHLGRDNLFVTVVGDFDRGEMLARLEEAFSGWRRAGNAERVWITREPVSKPGVYVVEKELPQPSVRVVQQIAVDRTAPAGDHAALEILNEILGGSGFRSRLMERLRSDEGLTYGIYSYLAHEGRPGVPGAVGVTYQTRKDAVARSIESVVEEIRQIIAEKVTPAEVQEQIEGWRNRFVFRYDNDFYSVSRLMGNELDDRPYDHDRRQLDAIQAVTVDDVQRVARSYLKPGNLTIAVFGALTDEDREALRERYGLHTLARETVFSGGYDAPETAPAEEPEPRPAPEPAAGPREAERPAA